MKLELQNLANSHDDVIKKIYKRLEFALKFRRSK